MLKDTEVIGLQVRDSPPPCLSPSTAGCHPTRVDGSVPLSPGELNTSLFCSSEFYPVLCQR